MEDEGRPFLQIAEIAESSEEIRGSLREFGADPTLRIDDQEVASGTDTYSSVLSLHRLASFNPE